MRNPGALTRLSRHSLPSEPKAARVTVLALVGTLTHAGGGVLGVDYHVDLLIYDVDDVPYPSHFVFYRADL